MKKIHCDNCDAVITERSSDGVKDHVYMLGSPEKQPLMLEKLEFYMVGKLTVHDKRDNNPADLCDDCILDLFLHMAVVRSFPNANSKNRIPRTTELPKAVNT